MTKAIQKKQNQAVTVINDLPTTPVNPIQAALHAGASPDQLLQFMELQERWEANEAKKAFTKAMANFRAECPTIIKDKDAHNSKFASIAGALRQIKGLMSDCGLSHSWRTNQEGNLVTVTCVVMHAQGHSEQTSLSAAPDTSGSKNAIQAIGSTVKYLERYTLEACLGLTSDDQLDDDGQAAGGAERITPEQALNIQAMLEENSVDLVKFESWLRRDLKCAGIDDIAVTAYPAVIRTIEETIKKKAAQ